MERGGIARWLLIGGAVFIAITLFSKFFGGSKSQRQPLVEESQLVAPMEGKPKVCDLWHPSFHAQLSTQGASLKSFKLLTEKYQRNGEPIDLVTTPDLPFYRPLRLDWRNDASIARKKTEAQVAYDLLNYQLVAANGKRCEFVYKDDRVKITKTVSTTEHAYQLDLKTTITNLADKPLSHALTVHTADWRTNSEVEGHMFRVSPYVTHVECVTQEGDATRLQPDKFDPESFEDPQAFPKTALNPGDWYQPETQANLAAVSNAYFSKALAPVSAPKQATPLCQLQIEYRYDPSFGSRDKDPNGGSLYRARLAYPKVTLAAQESATYQVLSYVGPKQREALAAAGHNLDELIDLGFFSAIAKVLVAFLLKVYELIPNWGIAIIVLTITARVLLFPLSVPSIKSMVKMRALKPEIDALNEKYKDDPQAKGLAQMELWRKHKVNPLKGCLPQLASMPVWFALYTTLQTAVELYNIPFLWFPDLSEPDPYYILPFIIGGIYFLQQKLMPMQADPAQQKMMMYFMPGMFTVFMLFLPAGLGVYMFTNSLLGIVQQQIVERHVKRTSASGEKGEPQADITAITKGETSAKKRGKGGKKRTGADSDGNAKLSRSPLLGKGKA